MHTQQFAVSEFQRHESDWLLLNCIVALRRWLSMEMWSGVSSNWTGLVEWTTGLDYWHFKHREKAKHAHSAHYFATVSSIASQAAFPSISRGQSYMHIQ